MAKAPTGGGTGSAGASPDNRLVLEEIARSSRATADALARLLAVARFGPASVGPGGGVPGVTGPAGGGGGGGGGVPGGLPSSAARAFAERQTELRERATAYSQAGLGSFGSGMQSMATRAQGLQTLGFGRAAGVVQGLAVPAGIAGAVASGVSTAARAASVLHDSFATGDQKARALFRMLPGGETMQGWYDSFTGRQDAIDRARVAAGERAVGYHNETERLAFGLSNAPRLAGAGATAGAYARGSAVVGGVFDTGTARGAVQREDDQRLLPYRRESARTEREFAAATAERVSATRQLVGLQSRQSEIQTKLAAAQRRSGHGSGAELVGSLEEVKNLINAAKETDTLIRDAHGRVSEARGREATARGARDTAKVREDMLGRADILEAQAQRSQATATGLGSMDPFQRSLGLQALKMLKDGANPDLMPPDLKAAAQAFAPAEVAKLAQAHGEKTGEFAEGRRLGLVGFEGRASELQKGADELRAEAGKREYGIEAGVAKEQESALKDLANHIVGQMKSMVNTLKMEITNQIKLGRSSS